MSSLPLGYLKKNGFTRHIVPDTCPQCYTVQNFADDHPRGTYILCISGHVVALIDGIAFDTWDSSDCVVVYYWQKEA